MIRYLQTLAGRRSCTAWAVAAAAAVTLTGCTVGPDYVAPDTLAVDGWNAATGDEVNREPGNTESLAVWWKNLQDPTLDSLIERAIAGNHDLKSAVARVRESRARRGITASGFYPTVDGKASATRSRSSANMTETNEPESSQTAGASSTSSRSSAADRTRELYSIGFDASWELDVFGGTRRAIEAADAEIEASEAELRDVMVSLLAEVALNYLDVRTAQAQVKVAQANLESQEQTYKLTKWRQEAGIATHLDVEQARSNLAQTRATLPSLTTELEQAKNRLAVLLGEQPGAVEDELAEVRPLPVPPIEIAVGVPAETLRRRPDIRTAERMLAAQTAQIGVARAELYPKFSLLGSIGLESLSADTLLDSASDTYSIGPSVSWRIFDAGAIRSNIDVQTALQEQALLDYELAVLTALEDVENALTAYAQQRIRQASLSEAVDAAAKAAKLSLQEYEAGIVDFQTVLDAQRTLLSVEDQQASSAGEVVSNLIRLYKALGGGWETFDVFSQPQNGEDNL